MLADLTFVLGAVRTDARGLAYTLNHMLLVF